MHNYTYIKFPQWILKPYYTSTKGEKEEAGDKEIEWEKNPRQRDKLRGWEWKELQNHLTQV
jgi:hypothetical protein